MNLLTFQAIGWFIGSAVILCCAIACWLKSRDTETCYERESCLGLAFAFLATSLFLFAVGWAFLSWGLFGGAK